MGSLEPPRDIVELPLNNVLRNVMALWAYGNVMTFIYIGILVKFPSLHFGKKIEICWFLDGERTTSAVGVHGGWGGVGSPLSPFPSRLSSVVVRLVNDRGFGWPVLGLAPPCPLRFGCSLVSGGFGWQ